MGPLFGDYDGVAVYCLPVFSSLLWKKKPVAEDVPEDTVMEINNAQDEARTMAANSVLWFIKAEFSDRAFWPPSVPIVREETGFFFSL